MDYHQNFRFAASVTVANFVTTPVLLGLTCLAPDSPTSDKSPPSRTITNQPKKAKELHGKQYSAL